MIDDSLRTVHEILRLRIQHFKYLGTQTIICKPCTIWSRKGWLGGDIAALGVVGEVKFKINKRELRIKQQMKIKDSNGLEDIT